MYLCTYPPVMNLYIACPGLNYRGAHDWYQFYSGIYIPFARFTHPSTFGRPSEPSPIKMEWSIFQDGGQYNCVN